MYFCPKCNYTFDVTKSILDNSNQFEIITSLSTIVKKINNKDKLTNVKLNLSLSDLEKDQEYIKLKESIKIKIKSLISKENTNKMIFKCFNCNYESSIDKTIILYNLNLKTDIDVKSSIDDNKIYIHNPILPRTKDYTCKNINCQTHKNKNNKEAVYIKNENTFDLRYICTICFTDWNLK
uniref:TFIIS-type domain-containing protein n=1 Tax=viral metagenome TaxID=1070528 RepID=A0A6C0J3F2_9ZZZZ